MTTYTVTEYSHTRDYMGKPILVTEDFQECCDLLNSLEIEFRAASIGSDDPTKAIVIRSNFPSPWLHYSRDAAHAFDKKDPNWKSLLR